MLPEGWKRVTLGDCARFLSGNTPSKERTDFWTGDFPWITAKDMKTLCLTSSGLGLTESGKEAAAIAPPLSVLVLTRGMTLLKDLPVGLAMQEVGFNQDVKALVAKPDIDPWFLAYQLVANKSEILDLVDTAGHGTGRLDTELLKAYEIRIAPMPEQLAAARIIRVWDEAIAAMEKLLANSRKQRQGIADAMLSGRRRLISGKSWPKRKLSDLIVESRSPGSSGDIAKKISVKLYGRGVVAKNEKRPGSESTQYYRRTAGQFIYSKLDFLNGAFGLIPDDLDGFESTLDLPAFDFKPGVDPLWFLHFVSREDFYLGHLGLANGGRKARRVNPTDLLRVSVPVPPLDEQQAISEAIGLAIADEEGWKKNLSLLQQQKRALMQQLLTGKRRVYLPEPGIEVLP